MEKEISFGKKVKIQLIKMNMKQKDLAEEINVSKSYLNLFLNEKNNNLNIEIKLLEWMEKNAFN
jgi:transcriptional regulator with XRE-family HTH domain